MKKPLLLLLLCCICSTHVFARWSEDQPVRVINSGKLLMYSNIDYHPEDKAALLDGGILTPAQYAIVNAHIDNKTYPSRIGNLDGILAYKSDIARYRAYIVASWQAIFKNGYVEHKVLIWVPKEGNEGMPDDLRPANAEGFFMIFPKDVGYEKLGMDAVAKQGTAEALKIPPSGSIRHRHPVRAHINVTHRILPDYDLAGDEVARYALVDTGKLYTPEAYEQIARLARKEAWPPMLRTERDLNEYHAYIRNLEMYEVTSLGHWKDNYCLYWVPRQSGADLPSAVTPEAPEGFFIVADLSITEKGPYTGPRITAENYLSYARERPYPHAGRKSDPEPRSTASGSSWHSTADMSRFVSKPAATSGGNDYDEEEDYSSKTPAPKTTYTTCWKCNGKGFQKITKRSYTTIGGTGTVGRTGYVDWQRAPSAVEHTSTETRKCDLCNGSGQIPK